MPRNRNKIIGAMFDVKPVDNTGAVDVSKVWDISPQINLRKRKNNLSRPKYWRGQNGDGELHIEKIIKETYSRIPEKSKIFEDLHQLLNARGSWKPTLTSLGIRIEGPASIAKPRRQPINIGKKSSLREIQERVLREMRQPLEPAYEVNLPEPELAAADIVPINLADQAAPAIPVPEQKAIEEWYHASLPTAERI